MTPAQRRRRVVVFLSLLAATQLMVLEWLNNRPGQDVGFITEGTSLAEITLMSASGRRTVLPPDGHRLQALLVFSADCPHCETVAPVWAEWAAARPPAVGLLAVTGDALETGEAFGRERGWDVEVAAVPPSPRPPAAEDMLKRTPWLFLLDAGGTVIFEGHGSRLAALDSAIVAHSQPVAPDSRSP